MPRDHTVVVPNRPDVDTPSHPEVLDAVRRAHRRCARLVGLCTGAFTLAEARVLDGRPAAVHWQLADEFRRRFPAVDLRPCHPRPGTVNPPQAPMPALPPPPSAFRPSTAAAAARPVRTAPSM